MSLISKMIAQNKRLYLQYNNFRKRIFTELSPKDSEIILYLVPWLLSVNNPAFPGYVRGLKKHFRVFNIQLEKGIMLREQAFKKMFNYAGYAPLLNAPGEVCWVQGIYTIGSVGTVSQTSRSDCDLWVCIDRDEFGGTSLMQFEQKINLIKDWLDANIKMPVYFFISDVREIRACDFGSVDYESCGSSQRNVLKEEFYRTSMMVCGRIPLWWVCFDRDGDMAYEDAASQLADQTLGEYDLIDYGNLEKVEEEEYFGAALWQFNKSLTHPLKSIIKMLLLKMLLESPREKLLCHKFRETVLDREHDQSFTDPSIFTMGAILEYSRNYDEETFNFIKEIFYLRYEIKQISRKPTLKEKYAAEIFNRYKIEAENLFRLNAFASWGFEEQTRLGDRIFALLLNIYKDVIAIRQGGEIAPKDLTIIGRKLSSCLEKKPYKIPTLHKPTDSFNPPSLVIKTSGRAWQVCLAQNDLPPVMSSADIVYCLAFLVWNDIYVQSQMRMLPNSTSVTMQEIINLGKKIKDLFGVFNISRIDFENFLDEERYTKMLVIVSFEADSDGKDVNDFNVLYINNWGELFSRRFNSSEKLKIFIEKNQRRCERTVMDYYIRRNVVYYEKIIERTKRLMAQVLND